MENKMVQWHMISVIITIFLTLGRKEGKE